MMRSMILACATCALGMVGCFATSAAPNETAVEQELICSSDCSNTFFGTRCILVCEFVSGVRIDIKCPNCVLSSLQIDELEQELSNSAPDINFLTLNQLPSRLEMTVLDVYLNTFDHNVTNNDIDVCVQNQPCK